MRRRKTRTIYLGNVPIGSGHHISVQSMTKTDTRDAVATINQIKRLEQIGCEIVRVAVPDLEAADAIKVIKSHISIPLVADIHFNYRLALKAIENGADGLRINPGNIGSRAKVEKVVKAAAASNVPIRIGVNSGSIEKEFKGIIKGEGKKLAETTARAMVKSALKHIRILEGLKFHNIKVSLKATDVQTTLTAHTLLARERDYPFHIGITEAGTLLTGAVKSAVGIAMLLLKGYGDTIRVSLSAPPEREVVAAYTILRALGLREQGAEVISCPTCARSTIDVESIAEEVEQRLLGISLPISVAVMGCAVNGPGEASRADYGVAGGRGRGVIFRHGKVTRRNVDEASIIEALLSEIDELKGRR
ncbi:MAG: flavodoxin-dependent (E)-4-hydroxy-3-methylbut-2-enyl-diphosphate synthase [Candidatus Abyssobacteria bacterium SURF_17]|uniref:4-hydroxy-3-methylbut-2-en-1-yl diphosphate synthase (flavodoxin) n=1 Tax=Candidatus Abyssobacteria bacterium SURF_17 TaxID=2093361 RepID=A0A419F9D7_9BACT|nr:MAG: flavodoxin-dependent (E)-4-hydroxy-3-methylbut-2-enyl-diphosphate synthase [Candidatus Abyssubacteria bacterium SURF_17]